MTGKPPPHWDQVWGQRGVHPSQSISSEMAGSGRAGMESDRFIMQHHVRNAVVSEIQNTPSGCAWPKLIHDSIKSSSWKESVENGVPSTQVATEIQM